MAVRNKLSPDLAYLIDSQETVPCPICHSDQYQTLYQGDVKRGQVEITCVICRNCTHMYLNPRPTVEAYSRFYDRDDYGRMALAVKNKAYSERAGIHEEMFFKERAGHGVRLYEQYLKGNLTKNDIVFDFGAGDGAWLYGLRDVTGCAIDGNEPMAIQVDFIRDRLGVEIFHAPIEELGPAVTQKYGGKVKLAIVSGSLQHMVDPMQCLKIARDILLDDGYLYICNWDVLDRMASPAPNGKLFRENASIDHVHYFHENSYRYMVQKSGFDVLNFEPSSTIRYKPRHMEIFAKKASVLQEPTPIVSCDRILGRIAEMESAVKKYRIFSLRYRLHCVKKIVMDFLKSLR
ncbi:MAG: class I SAM-dependent methyltransferase [Deltaproteobacteria bacterium]|nr:class I SAM-dependent methyltransferase [Deltaproteobacteria bacterium]